MTHVGQRARSSGGWIHRSLLVSPLFATIAVLAGLAMAGDVAAGVPAGHRVLGAATLAIALVGLLLLEGLSLEEAAPMRCRRSAGRPAGERIAR